MVTYVRGLRRLIAAVLISVISMNAQQSTRTLRFLNTTGTHFITFSAPSLTTNPTYQWPGSDGSSGQVLATDGSGHWAFAPVVTGLAAGTGISVSGSAGSITVGNTGVTSVNGSAGAITISAASLGIAGVSRQFSAGVASVVSGFSVLTTVQCSVIGSSAPATEFANAGQTGTTAFCFSSNPTSTSFVYITLTGTP